MSRRNKKKRNFKVKLQSSKSADYMLTEEYQSTALINSVAGSALHYKISLEEAIVRFIRPTYPNEEYYTHLLLDGKSPREVWDATSAVLDAMSRGSSAELELIRLAHIIGPDEKPE